MSRGGRPRAGIRNSWCTHEEGTAAMGDVRGFLKHERALPERRPVPVRIKDWSEVYRDFPKEDLQVQASRFKIGRAHV